MDPQKGLWFFAFFFFLISISVSPPSVPNRILESPPQRPNSREQMAATLVPPEAFLKLALRSVPPPVVFGAVFTQGAACSEGGSSRPLTRNSSRHFFEAAHHF